MADKAADSDAIYLHRTRNSLRNHHSERRAVVMKPSTRGDCDTLPVLGARRGDVLNKVYANVELFGRVQTPNRDLVIRQFTTNRVEPVQKLLLVFNTGRKTAPCGEHHADSNQYRS